MFIYLFLRERERVHARRGVAESEGGTEAEADSRLKLSAQSPTQGSNPRAARSCLEQKPRVTGLTDGATQASLFNYFKQKQVLHLKCLLGFRSCVFFPPLTCSGSGGITKISRNRCKKKRPLLADGIIF